MPQPPPTHSHAQHHSGTQAIHTAMHPLVQASEDLMPTEVKHEPKMTQGSTGTYGLLQQPVPSTLQFPCDVLSLVLRELAQQITQGQLMREAERAVVEELSQELQRVMENARGGLDCNLGTNGFCVESKDVPRELALTVETELNDQAFDDQFVGDKAVDPRLVDEVPLLEGDNGPAAPTPKSSAQLSATRNQLIDLFKRVDGDNSGCIAREELRKMLIEHKVPSARTQKLLKVADRDNSGEITLLEWTRVVESPEGAELSHHLEKIIKMDSEPRLKARQHSNVSFCMLHPNYAPRLTWDVIISSLLLYVAVVLPFNIAWQDDFNFESNQWLNIADWGVDIVFFVDVLLNFRTGYVDCTEAEIMDGRMVALHYGRTWFLWDVLSSLPLDHFTPVSSQIFKLGKVAKVSRVVKILRPARSFARLQELADDWVPSWVHRCKRRCGTMFMMMLFAHWFACGMKFFSPTGDPLKNYQDVSGKIGREYLACLYWAFTTLTTVGYGDIIPGSDIERGFYMIAMVAGGTFYGYVIGTICSIVANQDLNENAYYERMDGVNAWLSFHHFPRPIRKRVRKHFRATLGEQSVLSEAEIFDELSPTLREDLGRYLIKDEVMQNPLFDGLSISIVVRIQKILHHVTWEDKRLITTAGESGSTMYLIINGKVEQSHGVGPPCVLSQGDSFGEEILLGLCEKYSSTTKALTEVSMYMIHEEDFNPLFDTMPDVLIQMNKNALS